MKKILFFLPLLFTINLFSQGEIFPYRNLEFENYTPKWIHTTSDSSLINTAKHLDGYNHLALVRVSEEPLSFIKDNHLYNILISAFDGGINGSIIEKIDISTGQRVWMNHFDLRTNDRIEQPFNAFLTPDNQLEIINYRVIKETQPIFYTIGGAKVHTSIRTIDISNGNERSHIYSPDVDTTFHVISETHKLPNPIKKNDNNGYAHTYFSYGFLNEQIGLPSDKYYFISIQMDSLGVTTDTLYKIDPEIPFRQNATLIFGGIRHINFDTTIMLMGSYIPNSAKSSLITSLMMVNNKGEILRKFQFNNEILLHIFDDTDVYYQIAYSDDDFIVIQSPIDNKNYFFIFDLNKDILVDTFSMEITNGNNNGYILPQLLRLEGAEFLVAAGKADFSENQKKITLEFLKSSQNGSLHFIKSFSFNDGESLIPHNLYRLENSDVVFSGTHAIDSTFVVDDQTITKSFGNWFKTIYFSKEDLNLTTTLENINTIFDFNIFPNPTKNKLNLNVDESLIGVIRIYNSLGENILSREVKDEKLISLEVSSLSTGIYFVNLMTEDGRFFSKPFVKE